MELLDPTLKWQMIPFPQYFPNSILRLCGNLGLGSYYMIPEINYLGFISAGVLYLLSLKDTEVSIKFSLMKSRVAFLPSLSGELNLGNLNGVDT